MLKDEISRKIRRRKAQVIVTNLWWSPGTPTNYGTCDSLVRTALWKLKVVDLWASGNTSYFNEVLFIQTSKKQVRGESICIRCCGIFIQLTPVGWATQSPFQHCLSTVWPALHSKSPTGIPLPLERIVCKTHSSPRVTGNGIMSKYCWSMVLITPRLVGLIPICLRAGLDPCGPSSSEYPAAVILWDVLGGGSALQGPSSPCIFEVPGLDARRQSRGMGERMIWSGLGWSAGHTRGERRFRSEQKEVSLTHRERP